MNKDLKVAFITGGNRGIGLETARQLGKLGIHVVIGSRQLTSGQGAAGLLREESISAEALTFDVVNPVDRTAAFDFFQNKFGKLDILVNNAGVASGAGGDWGVPELTSALSDENEIRRVFDTNFFGVIATTQLLLPLIRKSEAGRIVNVSSILGSLTLHSNPDSPIYAAKAFAYNASKTALNAFTVHLAYDLRDTAIKVNSAHPGWVKTELGGDQAPMNVVDGAKTEVTLATLPADGPSGGFFHLGEPLDW